MTSAEYRTLIAQLGLDQGQAAEALGVSIRASNGYANGQSIPEPIARLLRFYAIIGENSPKLLPTIAP